jgi:hypothetical protein
MKHDDVKIPDVLPPSHDMGVTGAELVAAGATLVRLENDTQMTVAVQRPRNEQKILDGALKELELYPSLAEDSIYSKPVGKDEDGKMKYAQGLSIRTAESLANRWGNNAYGCEIAGEDENSAILSAVYLDYETNTRTVLQKRVSKHYKPKKGVGLVKYSPDRFDVILAANQSKLLREAILRRLPAGLKREYELKVKEILSKKPVGERQTKLIATFATLKVTQTQLEQLMNKPLSQFNHEDMTELVGAYNAIKDGETTIEALIEQKTTEKPNYNISEPDLVILQDYFAILKIPEAEQSMKLAGCKGQPEAIEALKKELHDKIIKMPGATEKKEGDAPAEEFLKPPDEKGKKK